MTGLCCMILLCNQYSGDGYRARALLYSLECFFDALDFSDLWRRTMYVSLPS